LAGPERRKKLVLMPSERVAAAAAAAARLVLFAEDVSPRFLIFDGEKKRDFGVCPT
jgi:hypothetical protein